MGMRVSAVRKALLYSRLGGGRVRCLLCERRCLIRNGERGYCGTRVNLDGELYTLVYGDLSAVESRPMEVKPFYHFWPGSKALTFSTWSCNFSCPWCQNFDISSVKPPVKDGMHIPPEELVNMALRREDRGLCASFNEPTMQFEYTLDVFRLSREKGLHNTYVSNGYMSRKALEMLAGSGLDGIKIDIKGDERVYREVLGVNYEVPWRNVELAKMLGLHVEVVFLVVTGISDDENVLRDVIDRHLKHAGPDTPLHINRYFPAYKYLKDPTPLETLYRAHRIARKEGVNFVYVGNVPGNPYEHTYCPECNYLLIKRQGLSVVEYRLTKDKKCPKCGRKIPVVGEYFN